MKRALTAIGIGLTGSVMLLAAPFMLPCESVPIWLSRLAYGPGNQLFGWLSEHRHVGPGERTHHAVVLATSLMCWWVIGGVEAYVLTGRGSRN